MISDSYWRSRNRWRKGGGGDRKWEAQNQGQKSFPVSVVLEIGVYNIFDSIV